MATHRPDDLFTTLYRMLRRGGQCSASWGPYELEYTQEGDVHRMVAVVGGGYSADGAVLHKGHAEMFVGDLEQAFGAAFFLHPTAVPPIEATLFPAADDVSSPDGVGARCELTWQWAIVGLEPATSPAKETEHQEKEYGLFNRL